MNQPPDKIDSPAWRFRFSLFSLLMFVVLVCVVLGVGMQWNSSAACVVGLIGLVTGLFTFWRRTSDWPLAFIFLLLLPVLCYSIDRAKENRDRAPPQSAGQSSALAPTGGLPAVLERETLEPGPSGRTRSSHDARGNQSRNSALVFSSRRRVTL